MTEQRVPYKLKRTSGPQSQPATNVIQAGTPTQDNLLIRRLVGKGNLSSFAYYGCMTLLYILYGDDSSVDERATETWNEVLEAIPDNDRREIANRLRDLAQIVYQG